MAVAAALIRLSGINGRLRFDVALKRRVRVLAAGQCTCVRADSNHAALARPGFIARITGFGMAGHGALR